MSDPRPPAECRDTEQQQEVVESSDDDSGPWRTLGGLPLAAGPPRLTLHQGFYTKKIYGGRVEVTGRGVKEGSREGETQGRLRALHGFATDVVSPDNDRPTPAISSLLTCSHINPHPSCPVLPTYYHRSCGNYTCHGERYYR
ncbi:hypothetical protein E2C01_044695 [Portunus trituberculatus]|uniref:Uncharacterized protein n=1 Tax=Portunus trituberculatus TaxID=210409 RepID=A0A5B7FTT2_PORTR|nr:hypothetical protein [Portunus trituberculatus]